MLRTVPLALALLASPAAAQTNAFGQPDLTGLWTNATSTNLERPAAYGDRLVMTPEEAARSQPMTINGEPRTSFLVAPTNGLLPDLTPATREARAARLAAAPRGPGFARGDNPESLTLAERCLKDFGSSSGPPMMPVGYNNTYQIVQTPDAVMILVEMIHDVRIIPLTKSRTRPAAVQQWMGDSIGWYEGDTLIVETTNFRPGHAFRGAPSTLKLIEKLRRTGDQVVYSFEIDDAAIFAAPIRAEIAMNAAAGPLFEYACHEGNYGMTNILLANRVNDVQHEAKMQAALAKHR